MSEKYVPVAPGPQVIQSLDVFEEGLGIVDMFNSSHTVAENRVCDPLFDMRMTWRPRAVVVIGKAIAKGKADASEGLIERSHQVVDTESVLVAQTCEIESSQVVPCWGQDQRALDEDQPRLALAHEPGDPLDVGCSRHGLY